MRKRIISDGYVSPADQILIMVQSTLGNHGFTPEIIKQLMGRFMTLKDLNLYAGIEIQPDATALIDFVLASEDLYGSLREGADKLVDFFKSLLENEAFETDNSDVTFKSKIIGKYKNFDLNIVPLSQLDKTNIETIVRLTAILHKRSEQLFAKSKVYFSLYVIMSFVARNRENPAYKEKFDTLMNRLESNIMLHGVNEDNIFSIDYILMYRHLQGTLGKSPLVKYLSTPEGLEDRFQLTRINSNLLLTSLFVMLHLISSKNHSALKNVLPIIKDGAEYFIRVFNETAESDDASYLVALLIYQLIDPKARNFSTGEQQKIKSNIEEICNDSLTNILKHPNVKKAPSSIHTRNDLNQAIRAINTLSESIPGTMEDLLKRSRTDPSSRDLSLNPEKPLGKTILLESYCQSFTTALELRLLLEFLTAVKTGKTDPSKAIFDFAKLLEQTYSESPYHILSSLFLPGILPDIGLNAEQISLNPIFFLKGLVLSTVPEERHKVFEQYYQLSNGRGADAQKIHDALWLNIKQFLLSEIRNEENLFTLVQLIQSTRIPASVCKDILTELLQKFPSNFVLSCQLASQTDTVGSSDPTLVRLLGYHKPYSTIKKWEQTLYHFYFNTKDGTLIDNHLNDLKRSLEGLLKKHAPASTPNEVEDTPRVKDIRYALSAFEKTPSFEDILNSKIKDRYKLLKLKELEKNYNNLITTLDLFFEFYSENLIANQSPVETALYQKTLGTTDPADIMSALKQRRQVLAEWRNQAQVAIKKIEDNIKVPREIQTRPSEPKKDIPPTPPEENVVARLAEEFAPLCPDGNPPTNQNEGLQHDFSIPKEGKNEETEPINSPVSFSENMPVTKLIKKMTSWQFGNEYLITFHLKHGSDQSSLDKVTATLDCNGNLSLDKPPSYINIETAKLLLALEQLALTLINKENKSTTTAHIIKTRTGQQVLLPDFSVTRLGYIADCFVKYSNLKHHFIFNTPDEEKLSRNTIHELMAHSGYYRVENIEAFTADGKRPGQIILTPLSFGKASEEIADGKTNIGFFRNHRHSFHDIKKPVSNKNIWAYIHETHRIPNNKEAMTTWIVGFTTGKNPDPNLIINPAHPLGISFRRNLISAKSTKGSTSFDIGSPHTRYVRPYLQFWILR